VVVAHSSWRDATIGIIAALPVEGAAMGALINGLRRVRIDDDPNDYRVGYLDSAEPARPHRVVLAALPQDNTRNAAVVCTDLIRTFQHVRCVVMTGIAGGVPAPQRPERHVRLGDVVVAEGIVDYGHARARPGRSEPRRSTDGISDELLRAAAELRLRSYREEPLAWSKWLAPADGRPMAVFARPDPTTDLLYVGGKAVPHPEMAATGHLDGQPKIHHGVLGSGDVLVGDPRWRDEMAARYNLLALEMEGSGVAAGASRHGLTWFMVRGIADYCDDACKNELWQPYAAIISAGYVRALLAECRPFPTSFRTAPDSGVMALLTDPEHDRLTELLDRLPELDLRLLWRRSAGELVALPAAPPVGARDLVEHLIGRNAGRDGVPPALALVEVIAADVAEPLAGELRDWSDRVARRLGLTEEVRGHRDGAAPPRRDPVTAGTDHACLTVQITPDGIDAHRCTVKTWVQARVGAWCPEPGGRTETSLRHAEEVVDRAVREVEAAWREGNGPVWVEFLLPTALLHLAVEWWRTQLDSAAPAPLCLDYPVAVRSLDRLRSGVRRMWLERWQALWQHPPAHRAYWGQGATDLVSWNVRLHGDAGITTVVLSGASTSDTGRDELDLALRAGVPVILWDRRSALGAESGALLRELIEGEPGDVHLRLRRLRQTAAEARDDHPGRHVALLWDDPYRLVETSEGDR
jgi:nucleoside phosphorylase